MDDIVRAVSDPDTDQRRRRLIERLVRLRKASGLTQAAVADLMGVNQPVVAEIESARTDVRLSTLGRYANAASRGQLELALVQDEAGIEQISGTAEAAAPYGTAADRVAFWAPQSLDALIEEQGTTLVADPRALVLDLVSADDWDDYFEALGDAGQA